MSSSLSSSSSHFTLSTVTLRTALTLRIPVTFALRTYTLFHLPFLVCTAGHFPFTHLRCRSVFVGHIAPSHCVPSHWNLISWWFVQKWPPRCIWPCRPRQHLPRCYSILDLCSSCHAAWWLTLKSTVVDEISTDHHRLYFHIMQIIEPSMIRIWMGPAPITEFCLG